MGGYLIVRNGVFLPTYQSQYSNKQIFMREHPPTSGLWYEYRSRLKDFVRKRVSDPDAALARMRISTCNSIWQKAFLTRRGFAL